MSAAFAIYPITPVPKPRMTRRDRWAKRPCVVRFFEFRDEVRLHGVIVPDRVRVVFVIPMPKSWSMARRAAMDGRPHTTTPDLDNLCKAIFDAVFENDAHIHEIWASKICGMTGEIRIGWIEGGSADADR